MSKKKRRKKIKEEGEEGEGDCGVFFREYSAIFICPFHFLRGRKKRNKRINEESRNDSSI